MLLVRIEKQFTDIAMDALTKQLLYLPKILVLSRKIKHVNLHTVILQGKLAKAEGECAVELKGARKNPSCLLR